MEVRITPEMSPAEARRALSEGQENALLVLVTCQAHMGNADFALFMFQLDLKRLYGLRIWELYELCDKDVERFIYHALTELPNQETGEWSVTGEYISFIGDNPERKAARQFGKPGSFWALENPPTRRDYEYPIL